MNGLEKVAEKLSWLLLWIGAIALLLLMLHVSADVAGKYIFNRPIPGTLEVVANYYMVACVFLPLAFVQLRRQHLFVEMFTLGLNTRNTVLLDGFVALLSTAYTGVLTWLVFNQAIDATIQGEIQDVTYFDLPVWPVRWILPLSFGLMTLILALQGVNDLIHGLTNRGRSSLHAAKDIAIT